MRCSYLSMTWVLMLVFTVNAQAQDAGVGSTTPPVTPTIETTPPPAERAKPAEKPSLEKTKSIEKARDAEVPPKPETTATKAAETPVSVTPASNPAVSSSSPAVRQVASFPCIALAFAMLILGAAAGFIGRHLMSRHKLGGMTVRVGIWRGIP